MTTFTNTNQSEPSENEKLRKTISEERKTQLYNKIYYYNKSVVRNRKLSVKQTNRERPTGIWNGVLVNVI